MFKVLMVGLFSFFLLLGCSDETEVVKKKSKYTQVGQVLEINIIPMATNENGIVRIFNKDGQDFIIHVVPDSKVVKEKGKESLFGYKEGDLIGVKGIETEKGVITVSKLSHFIEKIKRK